MVGKMIRNLGVQLFTVRKHTETPEALEETLRKLYNMGYRYFELARIQFTPKEMEVLKKLKEELGLIYTTSQIKLPVILKQFDWLMTFSKALDIKSIEVSVIPMKAFLGREKGLCNLAQQLNILGKRMKGKGISLLYHHHNFEMIRLGNERGIDLLMSKTVSGYVNFVADTYWLARSGVEPGGFIEKYDERIKGIHLRDCQYHFKGFKFKFSDSAVGDGTVDFRFLKKISNKFLSVEQATDQPFEMLKKSRDYLMKLKE
jgi:sugar phosphate isomerase/epimerase